MAEVTPEEGAYMDKVNESEAVQSMAEEVNVGLRTALETDSNLLAVYQALMSGEEAESGGTDGGDEVEASGNEVTVNGD